MTRTNGISTLPNDKNGVPGLWWSLINIDTMIVPLPTILQYFWNFL
jgi:hypothetical protein